MEIKGGRYLTTRLKDLRKWVFWAGRGGEEGSGSQLFSKRTVAFCVMCHVSSHLQPEVSKTIGSGCFGLTRIEGGVNPNYIFLIRSHFFVVENPVITAQY